MNATVRRLARKRPDDPVYARLAGPVAPATEGRPPCRFELAVVEWCRLGNEAAHARGCGCDEQQQYDACTRNANDGRHASQRTCPHYSPPEPPPDPAPGPLRSAKVDLSKLAPGEAGYRFNASLIPYKGRLLLAYRTGWAGSEIAVSEMAPDLTPGRFVVLSGLWHDRACYGREDPRLFIHKGQLHVSYIGVDCDAGGGVVTHQMFARLRDDLAVDDVFYPHFPGRNAWEKNWQFFDHGGQLYAVYSMQPWVVLRIDSNQATEAHRHAVRLPWVGGYARGGAAPVRVGDEMWCWFHGRTGDGYDARYNVGVAAFEAVPPFRPLRMTPHPLLWADPVTNAGHPNPNYCPVVFPCGAYLDGDRWRVSMGVHDRWIEVADWDHAAVDRSLRPL